MCAVPPSGAFSLLQEGEKMGWTQKRRRGGGGGGGYNKNGGEKEKKNRLKAKFNKQKQNQTIKTQTTNDPINHLNHRPLESNKQGVNKSPLTLPR